jgi:outer membrane protein TolC
MSFSRSKYLSASILMTEPSATTRTSSSCRPLPRSASLALCLIALPFLLAVSAHAQISLTTAVDLALRNSLRVRLATADVDKARAALAQAHDVYIPSIVGGSGLGYSYGVPVSPPSAFNFTAQSLAFNTSQRDYIRASQSGLDAANLTLMDVRQQVAEDTTVTYIALDYDIERLSVMTTQQGYATRLTQIVADRLSAGQDTQVEFTRSRRTAAQLKLQRLQIEEDLDTRREHLSRLTGLPAANLITIRSSIPTAPPLLTAVPTYQGPGIKAAYANAQAKQEQAFGDARKLWRPEIYFVAQYNRLETFNNIAQYYVKYNPNSIGLGLQVNFPMVNSILHAKARESEADAIHARVQADIFRDQADEGRIKLSHANQELAARVELAALDRELAQNQLDALEIQLQSGSGSDSQPQMTPKDEQNARIQERQRYLDLLDADFQLRETQINLLQQNGQLEDWLKSAAQTQPSTPLSVP